jgi:hypothetical protein
MLRQIADNFGTNEPKNTDDLIRGWQQWTTAKPSSNVDPSAIGYVSLIPPLRREGSASCHPCSSL